jgi:hypothetical protein
MANGSRRLTYAQQAEREEVVVENDTTSAVVVPIGGALDESQDPATLQEPWRMLADGTGMLVAWEPAPAGAAKWGVPLSATSGLARQLVTVVERAGAKLPVVGETLFRIELPAGQTVSNLIPAVGGGFRAMTRAGGTSKFAAHAKLLPVAGAATGTAVALGPLLGLVALSVGAEMLASRQQEAKLDAIKQVVDRIESFELDKIGASLDASTNVLEDAMAALLDRLQVPEAVGLGSTASRVKEIKALTANWVSRWETIASSFGQKAGGVPFDDLEDALATAALGGYKSFGYQVQLAYRSVSLDSRMMIVAIAEATLNRPHETVENFHRLVQRRLADNADELQRLTKVLWSLADIPLTVGAHRMDRRNRPAELQRRLGRIARALAEAPGPPPMLTADQRMVVEVVRASSGTVTVLAPRPELTA